MPLEATTMPVRLSIDGVGEAAELTRTPLVWWCCKVAAISDCKAINLQIEKLNELLFWLFQKTLERTLNLAFLDKNPKFHEK